MFFLKQRFFLLTSAIQTGNETNNGITLYQHRGRASVCDAIRYTAKMMNIEIGTIMPLFFSEISKKEFVDFNVNFKKIENDRRGLLMRSMLNRDGGLEIN